MQSNQFNNHDFIKVIAILSMVTDHVGYFLFPDYPLLRIIGRIAAPLFFFLIGQTGSHRITLTLVLYACFLSYSNYLLLNKLYISILAVFVLIRLGFRMRICESLSTNQFNAILLLLLLGQLLGLEHMIEYGCTGSLIALTTRWKTIAPCRFNTGLWLCSLLNYGGYMAYQFGALQFGYELVMLLGVMIFVIVLLQHFDRLPSIERVWLRPWVFISRYSLHIYFWHFILLQLIVIIR